MSGVQSRHLNSLQNPSRVCLQAFAQLPFAGHQVESSFTDCMLAGRRLTCHAPLTPLCGIGDLQGSERARAAHVLSTSGIITHRNGASCTFAGS